MSLAFADKIHTGVVKTVSGLSLATLAACGGGTQAPEQPVGKHTREDIEFCAKQAERVGDRIRENIQQSRTEGLFQKGPDSRPDYVTAAAAAEIREKAACLNNLAPSTKQVEATPPAAPVDNRAPVESRDVPSSSAKPLEPAPAPTVPAPVAVATPSKPIDIGTLPPYATEAIVSKDVLANNSFGDASLRVLAKTVMQSCDHGGCAAANNPGEIDKIRLGQFTDQTAQKFGMKATDPFQAVVAAGKLQVANYKALTASNNGKPPEEYQLALAFKLGADAVSALIKNPDKYALDVLRDAYKGNEGAARAVVDTMKIQGPKITSQLALEAQYRDYEAADAAKGAAILSNVMMRPVDPATFRNTVSKSLDQTPLGGPVTASAQSFASQVWNRVMYGQTPAAAGR